MVTTIQGSDNQSQIIDVLLYLLCSVVCLWGVPLYSYKSRHLLQRMPELNVVEAKKQA